MTWRRINWWMVAFFVALIAFEAAREVAVLALDPAPQMDAVRGIYRSADGNVINAQGRWEFDPGIDQGFVEIGASINCDRRLGLCFMAQTILSRSTLRNDVSVPGLTVAQARFTPTGVEFADDLPHCMRQLVRIDAVHDRAWLLDGERFAPAEGCTSRAPGAPSRLMGNPPRERETKLQRHFVPLMRVIAWIVPASPSPPDMSGDTPYAID